MDTTDNHGTSADRIDWAVNIMNIQPGDLVFEIGCGHGRAVDAISRKLETGHITAVDRSPSMVRSATKLNCKHIEGGKAEISLAEFTKTTFRNAAYGKIFLFNINVFWMDPKEELREVRKMLRTGGMFYIFHQPPPGNEPTEFCDRFRANLEANGFAVEGVHYGGFTPVDTVAVISSPI